MSKQSTVTVKPGPDPRKEKSIGYYEHAATVCEKNMGRKPGRATLYKYHKRGYPIKKGGPYVLVPVFFVLGKPMTTVEAMQRWVTTIRQMERKAGVPSAAAA